MKRPGHAILRRGRRRPLPCLRLPSDAARGAPAALALLRQLVGEPTERHGAELPLPQAAEHRRDRVDVGGVWHRLGGAELDRERPPTRVPGSGVRVRAHLEDEAAIVELARSPSRPERRSDDRTEPGRVDITTDEDPARLLAGQVVRPISRSWRWW